MPRHHSVTNIGQASTGVDTIKLQVTKKIPLNEWMKVTGPDDSIWFHVSVPTGASETLIKFHFYPKGCFGSTLNVTPPSVYAFVTQPKLPLQLAICWAGRFDREGGRDGSVRLEEQDSYDLSQERRPVGGWGVGSTITEHVIGGFVC